MRVVNNTIYERGGKMKKQNFLKVITVVIMVIIMSLQGIVPVSAETFYECDGLAHS